MRPMDEDRQRIVTGMCFTTRHDYGLTANEEDLSFAFSLTGMTTQQREALYRQMDQLYDHHINPLMGVLREVLNITDDENVKRRIQQAIKECGHG